MTKQEINTLVEGFPEYYRMSIHLALLVGGLRIGEVCGLQLRDIDELGHVDVDVAVRCYQRVVPRHRRDVVERLALEYLPTEDSAGIKAQIAQKEEEIDQLRQTVAGLRKNWKSSKTTEGNETRPDRHTHKTENRNIEKPKPVKTGIKRNRPHASKRYNIHNNNT